MSLQVIGTTADSKLAAEIENQLGNSTVKQYDILNRSQQKLAKHEEELKRDRRDKAVVDGMVRVNRDNIRKLILLVERDEAIGADYEASIQANLAAIDSLRKSGVDLPEPEEK